MKRACVSIETLAILIACDSGQLARQGSSERQGVQGKHGTVLQGTVRQLGQGTPSPTAAPVAVAPAPQQAPASEPEKQPTEHAAGAGDIDWSNSLHWLDYSAGLSAAKRSGKPIMLLVYADWCPKCRALAPVFNRPDVRALASKLVTVRQDQDDPAPWLSQLADGRGNYVPRVIFLDAQGAPLKITSGHPRYPYFYAAENPDALLSSLKQVLRI